MKGYRFRINDYLYPVKWGSGSGDVLVYSAEPPPESTKALYGDLPGWVAGRFRNNWRLHTVVTTLDGKLVEENQKLF